MAQVVAAKWVVVEGRHVAVQLTVGIILVVVIQGEQLDPATVLQPRGQRGRKAPVRIATDLFSCAS